MVQVNDDIVDEVGQKKNQFQCKKVNMKFMLAVVFSGDVNLYFFLSLIPFKYGHECHCMPKSFVEIQFFIYVIFFGSTIFFSLLCIYCHCNIHRLMARNIKIIDCQFGESG